jgi:hypothetical protein
MNRQRFPYWILPYGGSSRCARRIMARVPLKNDPKQVELKSFYRCRAVPTKSSTAGACYGNFTGLGAFSISLGEDV